MTELVPIFTGVVLGLLAGSLVPALSLRMVVLLSVPLGIGASAVTGELNISWGYILVDIPEVALSAAVAFALARAAPLRSKRVT